MKTRKLWSWMLVANLALVLQVSTAAKAQDNGQDQQYPNQNQNQNQQYQNPQDQNQDQNRPDGQDQDQDQDQSQDPPGRVARLDFSRGSISFRPAGEDDWVTAVPNRPMVTGDDLWADEDSRAEVHVGSSAIRLGPKTGITFLALDDNTTQIRLAQGSLIVRVRHVDDDDNYEIDTPNIAFNLLQPGEYRIDVSADGSQTVTTVWHGRGRVTGGGFTYSVVANQTATFTGNNDHVDYDLGQIPRRDDFDSWAFDRDDREDHADSANYVSREMTGYEDLDDNGDWSYVAGYGPCWRPRAVVVGWAPYRYGHWVFLGRWGWTWVEDEPWGFAPFHYGRWAFVNANWFWVPGPVVVRPVWAPALVAFVGGGHFSAGVGVGWFPLAPGEVFVPGYRVSRRYVNNVNITNTTVNITKVTNVYNTTIINRNTTVNNITYVNQHVNNGVTVVSHDTFVHARPVAGNVMRVEQRELVAAPVTRMVPAEPVRESVVGAGRPARFRPPTAIISRPVVAVRTPPPPPRPIEERQAQAGGHLNGQVLVRPMAPAQPAPGNQGMMNRGTMNPGPVNRAPVNQVPANQGGMNQGERPPQNQEGFKPFTPPNSRNSQVKTMPQPQPRVYEQEGNPQPENRNAQYPENRNMQQPDNRYTQPPVNRNQEVYRPPQQQEQRPSVQEESHPLVRQAPPVQERSPQQEQQQEQKFHQWQEQRPSSPPPQQQRTSSPPPQQHPSPPSRSEPPKSDKPKK